MSDIQTEARTPVDKAKGAASDVASDAAGKASGVVEQTKDEAKQVVASAGEHLSDVVGTARTELRDRARSEAGTMGESLSAVAEELRAMAKASSEQGGMAAGVVGGLADQVDRGAERLSAGDLDQVLDDAKRFARNRPGAFLLGAAGAGFLVGRLLRSADLKQVGEAAKPDTGPVADNAIDNGAQPAAIAAPSAANPGSTPSAAPSQTGTTF